MISLGACGWPVCSLCLKTKKDPKNRKHDFRFCDKKTIEIINFMGRKTSNPSFSKNLTAKGSFKQMTSSNYTIVVHFSHEGLFTTSTNMMMIMSLIRPYNIVSVMKDCSLLLPT